MTQSKALDVLKLGHNIFLTGSAGSGKTFVLNQYIDYLRSHEVDVGVTASTGIAATHMNGVTIHSWSGLGIRDSLSDVDIDSLEEKQYLWKRFNNAKVLIIDEVSMLHHFRLDLVERVCRAFKRNNLPFGGLQVILCGDFFQLPPVQRRGEEPAHFVYRSEAWKNMNLKICYLHEQFRQKDNAFLSVLNSIRENRVTGETLDHLSSRHNKEIKKVARPTKLYTHNIDVDSVNQKELEKLPGEIRSFAMAKKGNPRIVEILQKSCLAPQDLQLKKGAQVMFVKNNYEMGYVNGTLGTVIAFEEGMPLVETLNGKQIMANPIEWDIEEEGRTLAEIKQVPLRLAWAITVHKSQGMSLDAVEIDLSKSFERGMGYVALSRVRSLEGLKLLGWNDMALEINPEVLEFDGLLQDESEKAQRELELLGSSEKINLQKHFIDRIAPKGKAKKEEKVPTHYVTKRFIEERKSLKTISKERELKSETIIDHIEKLKKEGEDLDIEYLRESAFTSSRFQKIADAFSLSFEQVGDYRLAPVKNSLGSGFTYEEIRLARLFIEPSK